MAARAFSNDLEIATLDMSIHGSLTAKTAAILACALALSACRWDNSEEDTARSATPTGGEAPASTSNTPPVMSGNPPESTKVGETYSFQPEASDAEGDPLTFSIENKPHWADFDTSSGTFSGLPQAGDEGTYEHIKITADDGAATDSLTFSVTVTAIALGSVTLSWTAPTQNTDGTALTNLAGYKIYYGLSEGSYTNHVVVSNPGITTYVLGNLTPNTYHFVATALTNNGIESDFSNVTVKSID